MAYRINYPPGGKKRGREVRRGRLPALTALCFLGFLLLVQFLWPEGAAHIRFVLDQLASGLQKEDSVLAALLDVLTVFSV